MMTIRLFYYFKMLLRALAHSFLLIDSHEVPPLSNVQ